MRQGPSLKFDNSQHEGGSENYPVRSSTSMLCQRLSTIWPAVWLPFAKMAGFFSSCQQFSWWCEFCELGLVYLHPVTHSLMDRQSVPIVNWKTCSGIKLSPLATKKLLNKWLGPFEVVKRVGEVAYELLLPASMSRIHPVAHTSAYTAYHHCITTQPVHKHHNSRMACSSLRQLSDEVH